MDRGTLDLARHNVWATTQVLNALDNLDEAALNATVPGTFGTILETIQHVIDSEASYVYRLTGAWSSYPWKDDYRVGLDVLRERADSGRNTGEIPCRAMGRRQAGRSQ